MAHAIKLAGTGALERVTAVEIRICGRVQGVGFRPAVWRLAHALRLGGEVFNEGGGVTIRLWGPEAHIDDLLHKLEADPPPLAKIEAIEQRTWDGPIAAAFRISDSVIGRRNAEISPDCVICAECAAEISNRCERRYRYPFANCTHCGPRLSIVHGIPYDRRRTAMAAFPMCAECAAEYNDPLDRRFHAEAIACHACGPKARLVRLDGRPISFGQYSALDDVDAAGLLLQRGHIVAVKGLGGYQLACDATNEKAVWQLRESKHRDGKPFALMARDLAVIARYCTPDAEEIRALRSVEGPIVLTKADGAERLPDAVAPGLSSLGFMLPTTPLHNLMMHRLDRPVVMTSGNRSGEPQAIDDCDAAKRLRPIAEFALMHDREIHNRVDDSVVRFIGGATRVVRRARGYAPSALALPPGFETAAPVLAFGGDQKSTFCFLSKGRAVLSMHIGDLDDADTYDAYRDALTFFADQYDQVPVAYAIDRHPEYLSSKLGRARGEQLGIPVVGVQHHHAHVAACMAENEYACSAPPILGVALDGLGFGENGALWGGEFLLADYVECRRLATFKPVALLGAAKAMKEPWRNLYAHLMAATGWSELERKFSSLPLCSDLTRRPRAVLDRMISEGIRAPLASSCGRLFDAVAAAVGICRDGQSYEGEAASRLESLVDRQALEEEDDALAYPFAIRILRDGGLPYVEPQPMWNALLGDLLSGTPAAIIAARFHKGLAAVIAQMVSNLASDDVSRFAAVALTGGCFQNKVLFEETWRRLTAEGFKVMSHSAIPANDGGLALGQAAVAAARLGIGRRMEAV